jgi:hypothetical protein
MQGTNLPFEHKYQDNVRALPNCPPDGCRRGRRTCFRFVFDDVSDPNNFVPVLKRNPKRALKMSDLQRCSGWALSFFITLAQAVLVYEKLQAQGVPVKRALGTQIARGSLGTADGLMTDPDDDGHFDLHEVVGLDLIGRFKPERRLA